MADVIFFDGESAVGRVVTIGEADRHITLRLNVGRIERVDPSLLRRLTAASGQRRYGRVDRPGWRLVLEQPLDPAIEALLPTRMSAGGRPIRKASLAIAAACGAIAFGLVGAVLLKPVIVAAALPLKIERRLGERLAPLGQMVTCDDLDANLAIDKLLDRIDPGARKDGFTVELVYSNEVNALALPGGRILVFTGLIQQAADSDAVAGALAHEVAHVRRRHIAAQMVRQMGVQGVIKMIGGGGLANGATNLLSRKFSRDDEAQADSDAVAMLAAANISPRTTADLFKSLTNEEGDLGKWLADHPGTSSREAKFRNSFRKGHRYRFVLSNEEEEALYSGCRIPSYY